MQKLTPEDLDLLLLRRGKLVGHTIVVVSSSQAPGVADGLVYAEAMVSFSGHLSESCRSLLLRHAAGNSIMACSCA